MGISPVAAIPKVLAMTGLAKEDIDVWEVRRAMTSCMPTVDSLQLSIRSTKHLPHSLRTASSSCKFPWRKSIRSESPFLHWVSVRLLTVLPSGGSIALTHPLGMSEYFRWPYVGFVLTRLLCSWDSPGCHWSGRAETPQCPAALHEHVHWKWHGRCLHLCERGPSMTDCCFDMLDVTTISLSCSCAAHRIYKAEKRPYTILVEIQEDRPDRRHYDRALPSRTIGARVCPETF